MLDRTWIDFLEYLGILAVKWLFIFGVFCGLHNLLL